ncbi:hypothetical protein M413DRAFT_32297 [Hebeloma cylindrosporum]|uniref:Uncharacterized protein n=1 Tax=Hebeloma cylindrosporum TaxID=76867 RepID=A0A0C3BG86_HEBCY|nr:hypothetical protein M413DRAFT_32297 [Hebeloma cylindrosporum h7]
MGNTPSGSSSSACILQLTSNDGFFYEMAIYYRYMAIQTVMNADYPALKKVFEKLVENDGKVSKGAYSSELDSTQPYPASPTTRSPVGGEDSGDRGGGMVQRTSRDQDVGGEELVIYFENSDKLLNQYSSGGTTNISNHWFLNHSTTNAADDPRSLIRHPEFWVYRIGYQSRLIAIIVGGMLSTHHRPNSVCAAVSCAEEDG